MKRILAPVAITLMTSAAILVPTAALASPAPTENPLMGAVVFSSDVTEMATVSGTGTPAAEVFATTPGGDLATHATVTPAGTWSAPLTPPNAGGAIILDIFEATPEGTIHDTTATAEFGDAVVITSPVSESEHLGGLLEFTGTGEPGAQIYLNRGSQVITSGHVTTQGTWSMQATIGSANATYEVLQIGKGANVTTDTVAITGAAIAPLVVTSPTAGSTTIAPSGRLPFRGTGTPGATLSILDDNNSEIGVGTIGKGGTFNITATLRNGTNSLTLRYTTPDGSTRDIAHTINVIAPGH